MSTSAATTKTRNGKIARLPRDLRHELNRRLENGDTARQLVDWLNPQLAVQQSMATHFKGRPITEQNLSEWKRGGFQEWLRDQDSLAWAGVILDNATELTGPGNPLTDRLSSLAALAIVKVIRAAGTLPLDSLNTQKVLLDAVRTFNLLRSSDHQAARLAGPR